MAVCASHLKMQKNNFLDTKKKIKFGVQNSRKKIKILNLGRNLRFQKKLLI